MSPTFRASNSDYKYTLGHCGILDGIAKNDHHDMNGTKFTDGIKGLLSFISKWR